MKDQFIPYKQSLELKELGYNEKCFGFYYVDDNDTDLHYLMLHNKNSELGKEYVTAPLWQQAFDWFREEHNLTSFVWQPYVNTSSFEIMYIEDKIENRPRAWEEWFKAYEEARLACLDKLIEIGKEINHEQ